MPNEWTTACFLTSLQLAAGKMNKSDAVRGAKVHTEVHIGNAREVEGYGLSVNIKVEGVHDQDLIDAGHQVSYDSVCTYLI